MKTLIVGAGPLGSLYAHLLHKAGNDVTVLARNEHFKFIKEHGIVLFNEFSQEKTIEMVKVVDKLSEEDSYNLLIVVMRKNYIQQVMPLLNRSKKIPNILFMGNNALGFDFYSKYLPKEKVLFGFPGGGGSLVNHIAHYIDAEKPNGKRMPATIGEIDGKIRDRTKQIQNLFENSKIPVNIVEDIDAWLKYHVAFVSPIAGALLKSGDNYKLALDHVTIRTYIKAVKEGGRGLKALGFKKRYPFKFNLFYWMPELLLINVMKKLFNSKFAEIGMMMHVNAAKDEMRELADEFKVLINKSAVKTPNLDELTSEFY